MTLTTTTTSISYSGTGLTFLFNVPYQFFNSDEIEVYKRVIATGVETLQVEGTNYVVTGGVGSIGQVDFTADPNGAPATTEEVHIRRTTDRDQQNDFTPAEVFPAASVERALDRSAARDQEDANALTRTARIPVTDSTAIDMELPNSVTRASKLFGFDSSGVPTMLDNVVSGTTVTAAGTTTGRLLSDRFSEPMNVRDFGAVGASGLDAAAFQAAVDTGNKHFFVPVGLGTYTVNLKDLNYGSGIPVRWEFEEGARTTDVKAPQAYVFPSGGSATDQPMEWIPDAADQVNVYSVRGTNNAASTGKLFAYDFNLTAGANTTDDEPIRGLIGRCTNLGTGSVKSVRVGATDSSASGATALMAIACDVNAQANTNAAYVLSVNNQSANGIDDVVNGAYFNSNNGARWKNGIVFDQGDEYEDAVFQASMGSGSATAARFLKLKDASAAVLFSVAKSGEVFSADSLHAGVSTSNSVKISTSKIERTAAAGDLTIESGSNSGRILVLDSGGSTSQFVLSDTGVKMSAATGAFKGVGTINAKAFFDDGVAVPSSSGTTGGSGAAGAGNQYVELTISGTTYKVLHDGTV